MNKNVYIKTLGCKVNSFDSASIAHDFLARGFKVVCDPELADVNIINSCSVTVAAEREARLLARRYKRARPSSKVVVTGCYAQTNSAALAELEPVDFVVPNQQKHDLVNLVGGFLASPTSAKLPDMAVPVRHNRQGHFKSSAMVFGPSTSERSRAFLKIQDGCNGFCAYCLIPYARGASTSVDPAAVNAEVQRLVQEGYEEIVFTGIHLGDYGEDRNEGLTLAKILTEVIQATPESLRFRISSLEPGEISEELMETFRRFSQRFCAHFHLPLQSGHDATLKRMRRRYDTHEYAEKVNHLRGVFPRICIGADVIPGFPGETDADHRQTLAFIQGLPLDYLHVFPYSKRPNTAAEKMPQHVDGKTVKNRAKELRDLSLRLSQRFYREQVGTEVDVLWEDSTDIEGRRLGLTGNYLKVALPTGSQAKPGTRSACRVHGLTSQQTLLVLPLQN